MSYFHIFFFFVAMFSILAFMKKLYLIAAAMLFLMIVPYVKAQKLANQLRAGKEKMRPSDYDSLNKTFKFWLRFVPTFLSKKIS